MFPTDDSAKGYISDDQECLKNFVYTRHEASAIRVKNYVKEVIACFSYSKTTTLG